MKKPIATFFLSLLSFACATSNAQDIGATATKTVDTLNELAQGPHKGYRANHAKGSYIAGTFNPTPEAQTLSVAPHFKVSVPVVVRFSTGTGVPTLPDTSPNARPYGMAIRFELPNESFTDIVSISYNGFPVGTPDDFLKLLTLIKTAPSDTSKPSNFDKFLAAHPAAAAFVKDPKPVPKSFANQTFYGVNSFIFINEQGKEQYFRYRIVPKAGVKFMDKNTENAASSDILMQEIVSTVKNSPVEYIIQAQLPSADDPLLDGSIVWPETRNFIDLGILKLDSIPQNISNLDKQMFNPLMLPKGISASADPVLQYRPVVYAVSYGRRIN